MAASFASTSELIDCYNESPASTEPNRWFSIKNQAGRKNCGNYATNQAR